MRKAFAAAALSLCMIFAAASSAGALTNQTQSRQVSKTAVGPWSVMGWIAPNGNAYCSAERDIDEVKVAFVRLAQGYLMIIRSPQWWLTLGAEAPVRLTSAGIPGVSLRGKAIGSNMILVQLTADAAGMRRMAEAPEIEVLAADATIKIPLDRFADALTALDDCLAQASKPAAPAAPAVQAPITPPDLPPKFPTSKMGVSSLMVERAVAA